MAKLKTVD